MKLIIRILITALALLIVAKLVPGVTLGGLYPAIMAALILGLLNVSVKPLIVLLTLPLTVVSLGLFIFVINGLLLWFVASFLDGFYIANFASAFVSAFLVTVISTIGNWFIT